MRILHTSDWHLGRAFHGVGMLTHQATYIDHLLDVVATESVDLVVLAGDVYDRGLPPVDAVALANEAIGRLAASRARVVITSGNHDSARRLGFAASLIDHAGVHLRTDADTIGIPVILDGEDGPVAVYGIPYLDPDTVRRAWDLPHRSHEAALSAAMTRVREDLAGRSGVGSVVIAHTFVTGGQPSDSERDICVGGISTVPAGVFDGIDYVALGHLHGRQIVNDRVRYSGSPLAYSFSEATHRKGSWLVDLRGDQLITEFVPAPIPRPLGRIRGAIDDLLVDPAMSIHEESWLQVTLTDAERPKDAMDRLRARFPHALALQFDPVGRSEHDQRRSVIGRTDAEVAADFLAAVRGTGPDESEADLFQLAVDSCCVDPEADVQVSA